MTTGRINQVATRTRGFEAAKDRISSGISCELLESVFSVSLLCCLLNFRSSVQCPQR